MQRIIAVEEHIATDAYLDTVHRLDVVPGDSTEMKLMRAIEQTGPLRAALTDIDARIVAMNAVGQTMAILSINPPGVQPYPAFDAVPLARAVNDTLAGLVRARPDRFGALGTVAPQDPAAAAAEIERIMGPLGLHGIMINSHTFDRYPALTIVLGHLGEGIPYWLRRIDNRHAFTSRIIGGAVTIPRLRLTPSEYFRRNFVLTTSGMDDPAVLDLALTAAGEDSIMFAIDAPYEDTHDAVEFLRTAPLTDAQRAKISHATAERVFHLH